MDKLRISTRLQLVAQRVVGPVHVDIGSDHGQLLRYLLLKKQIRKGIAVENKRVPFQNSERALMECNADVRLADGFLGVEIGEANSASICGMGGLTAVKILQTDTSRIPPSLIVQVNRRADALRAWAYLNFFHLIDEVSFDAKRSLQVLQFQRSKEDADPAYQGCDWETAILLGPHHIHRRSREFLSQLCQEREALLRADYLDQLATRRLIAIDKIVKRSKV